MIRPDQAAFNECITLKSSIENAWADCFREGRFHNTKGRGLRLSSK